MKSFNLMKTPFKGYHKDVELEQLSCIKSRLAVTNMKQAILFKNPNEQNRLEKHLDFMERIRQHQKDLHELSQKNFLIKQKGKLARWSEKMGESCQDITTLPRLDISQLSHKENAQTNLLNLQKASGKASFPKLLTEKSRTQHVLPHPDGTNMKQAILFKNPNEHPDGTFITQARSCLKSESMTQKRPGYKLGQKELLPQRFVDDKRFYKLESILFSYMGHKERQNHSLQNIVNLYKQKTGFNFQIQ